MTPSGRSLRRGYLPIDLDLLSTSFSVKALAGSILALDAFALTRFGSSLALVGKLLALVGQSFAFVRDSVALIGKSVTPIGHAIPLIGDPLPAADPCLTLSEFAPALLVRRLARAHAVRPSRCRISPHVRLSHCQAAPWDTCSASS